METEFYENMLKEYGICIRYLIIEDKNSKLPEINAHHEEGKSDDDVEHIFIECSTMHYIPENLSTRFSFSNTTQLVIDSVGLKELTQRDLKGFPHLISINIADNDLESLPSDLFVNSRMLKRILFGTNKIKHIGKHLLAPLKIEDIVIFDLAENVLINEFYVKNADEPFSDSNSVAINRLTELIAKNCQQERKVEVSNKFLYDLWTSRMFSDFKFIFNDGREILTHKNILAAQSPVFTTMFSCKLKESRTNECQIQDVSYEAFENFLEFLYTRKIPAINDHILEVYGAAVKYQIEMLTTICEELIWDNVNEENALKILKLGNLHGNELMKILAMKQIQKAFSEQLPDILENQPEKVEQLMQAEKSRVKKIQQANDELEQAKKLRQLKCDQAEDEMKMIYKKIFEN